MSAFEIMKNAKLIDWHALIIGLEHGWCEKKNLITYAEECLREAKGEIDSDLINIVAGESIDNEQIISICLHYIGSQKKPLSIEKKHTALEKWRFAHLTSLLESKKSEEKKINELQELYGQFGFPDDMASCSIYKNDNINPLIAAKNVVQKLTKQIHLIKMK